MTPGQWRLYHAVTHLMLLALLGVWGLFGFGVYRWVRS